MMTPLVRSCTLALAAVATAFVSACGATTSGGSGGGPQEVAPVTPPTDVLPPELAPVGTLPDGPSALRTFDRAEFPAPAVDTSLIIPGGPPPDGIPPIDSPKFLPVADNLQLLDPPEPVVVVEVNGDARAYPVRIMIWHEIVNDVVGGVPVAVTYCPLCNSASTYVREINGVETTFGTSGLLFASALVMYDRATESLWTHFDGRAVVGMLTGAQLDQVASPLLSWEEFRLAYPDGLVLDETRTGHSRAYGRNPYVGYDDVGTRPFLFRGLIDDRSAAKERVVGIEIAGEAKAFTLSSISGGEARATNDVVGRILLAIFWKAGQASALDDARIADGRDVGSVGVFDRVVGGETLTFSARDGEFYDDQTGSRWRINGEAVEGPLDGTVLERVPHLDTFWFAWATYKPDTVLIEAPDAP
jgi:hypothetical protein